MIELIEHIQGVEGQAEADETLTLPYYLRQKSRQRVHLDGGREAALLLPHRSSLVDGDHLRSVDGLRVRVCAAPEDVSTARSDDALRLLRASYHLGNRHVSLEVDAGWLRYQPDHVLDDMVRGLGLTVTHEAARFEPERGAYHGHAHTHDDGHPHTHDHAHSASNSDGSRP